MKLISRSALYCFILMLTSCGGGSSSSGGGADSLSGTYTGSWMARIVVPELPNNPPSDRTFAITIVVTGNQINISSEDGLISTGQINQQNQFTAMSAPDATFVAGNLDCQGQFTFSGSVTANLITGESRALFSCVDLGDRFNLLFTGPISASR